MIEAFVDCIPPTATSQGKGLSRTKTGRTFFFKKPRQQAAEQELYLLFQPHRPKSPLIGPLRLDLSFYFPYRKTESKKVVSAGYPVYKTTTPDCDNMSKGLQDVLSSLGYWKNDSQIVQLSVAKYWSGRPGIQLCVKEIRE